MLPEGVRMMISTAVTNLEQQSDKTPPIKPWAGSITTSMGFTRSITER